MSFFRRALLYLMRKPFKTLSLFFIILLLATLALSSLSLKDALETAQLNVRESIGGHFTVKLNEEDTANWEAIGSEYGVGAHYIGKDITSEIADFIAEQTDDLQGYSASCSYPIPLFAQRENGVRLLSLSTGSSVDQKLRAQAAAGDASLNYRLGFRPYVCTNSSFDYYFKEGYFTLTEGRHITQTDIGSVIINEEIAKLNKLDVGDTFQLGLCEYTKPHRENPDATVTVEIVGLFRINVKTDNEDSFLSADNMFYTSAETLVPFYGERTKTYDAVFFYVKDPGEIERIADEVESLPIFQDGDFLVERSNSEILAVAGPLANINRIVQILIVLVLVIGLVVLYLVLSLRIKGRMHEIGILISSGFRKAAVIGQYLIEITIISVLAFSAAILCSYFVSKTAGDALLQNTVSNDSSIAAQEHEDEEKFATQLMLQYNISIQDTSLKFVSEPRGTRPLTEIHVSVQPTDVAALYIIGLVFAWLSVLVASIPLFRLKPREILTKMS